MSEIVIRQINGKKIGINPRKARQVLFDSVPDSFVDGDFDVKEIARYLLADASHLPLVLKHEITSACELNCSFCYIKGHVAARHTTFEEAKRSYDWLIERGLFYAILTGGNPVLNPDFCSIYRYLKERGIFVDVYTNGLSFSDEVFGLFGAFPPRSVEISFYASEKYRPEPFRVAERLISMGIHVLAKVTLTTDTVDLVPEMVNWAEFHGLRLSLDSDLFNARDGFSVDQFMVAGDLGVRDDLQRSEGEIPRAFNCSAGHCSVFIDCDGQLGFCTRSKIRFDGPLPCGYEKLKAYVEVHRDKVFSEKCIACAHVSSCRMCIARAELDDAGHYSISSSHCVYSE